MIPDVITVVKKELKEIMAISFSRSHVLASLLMIGLLGFFIPWKSESYFLRQTSVTLSMYILLTPLIVCSGFVADSFAGEKERKTLESLLATRIPDSAVFTGKIIAIFIYTYLFLLIVIFTSVGGANFYLYQAGKEEFFFYNSLSCFALFVFTIPVIIGGIAIGVFFSLQCKDTKTAFQLSRIGWFILSFPFITGWINLRISWDFLMPGFYILAAIDAALIAAGIRFFRRSRILAS